MSRRALPAELFAALADLVLPGSCAGCGTERVPLRYGTCAACADGLESLLPAPAVPVPAPPGLPPCTAVGPYAGPLREVLLAYKERGRHRLAAPLGALLAGAVAEGARRAGRDPAVPLLVVAVPSTAAARRRRHGDHLTRLGGHVVRRLRAAGRTAQLVRPLVALPRPDSAGLDTAARRAAAESSLRIRPGRGGALRGLTGRHDVWVIDDIVTTGATLAAVAHRLEEAHVHVTGAAVLAATQLRGAAAADRGAVAPPPRPGPHVTGSVHQTRGDGRASAG